MMFLYSCSVCVIRGRIWCKFRQIFIRDYVILRKFYTEIMTLNCRGTLVDLTIPKIMGILNLTPDSFYDGGRFDSWDAALKQTKKMLEEGATIIDVGAVSSRPGATALNTEEESKRLFPLLSELLEGEKLITSAESRFAANSKLLRVRVLGSKNSVATRRPCSAGNLRTPVTGRDRNR